MAKAKYEQSTPEWHLWSQIESNQNLVTSYAADSERALSKMTQAQERVDTFKAALAKLDPEFKD